MGPSFGRWLTYDQIPPEMRAAIISTEDRRFRSHLGVDPIGIARALGSAVVKNHKVSATSTLTQQLARNIFLTNNRSFVRKIKEGILALALERKFSKDQILELYLNRVYFGGGAYGIDAASAEILRPWRRPSQPRGGGDHRRAGQGAVQLFADRRRGGCARPLERRPPDDGEERLHHAPTPRLASIPRRSASSRRPTTTASATSPTGRFPSSIRSSTRRPTRSTSGRRSIPAMQVVADRSIRANAPDGAQGALVAMDRDGAVRAMVGGKDYVNSIYNRGDPGRAPAGLRVQAVRLSDGARIGDEADRHDRRRAGDDQRLEPAQLDPHQPRPGDPARSLLPLDQHDQREDRAAGRVRHHRRHGAAVRDHDADLDLSVDGSGFERCPADRDDARLRLGRQQRASR